MDVIRFVNMYVLIRFLSRTRRCLQCALTFRNTLPFHWSVIRGSEPLSKLTTFVIKHLRGDITTRPERNRLNVHNKRNFMRYYFFHY